MSTFWKIGIPVLVVIIILGAGIWYSQSGGPNTVSDYSNQPAQTLQQAPDNSQSAQPNDGISATDTSDASLDSDMNTIDGQMTNFNSDSASADQSLNDQPVSQN
jgi:hypothetical protein